MRLHLLACATAFTLLGPLTGFAGEAAYKPEDIVKFFSQQEATRGICVGTEQECGLDEKKPAGFNLQVNFGKDSAALTEGAKDNLRSFAAALMSPSLSVANFAIEGYTDASGTDGHNQQLSERRAQAVVEYLAELGIGPSKLKPVGFGESKPIAEDSPYDPENRRVETRLILE